jgi:hypothetical protein
VEGGEKDVFPSPSKGNQTWNILRATKFETFQGPLSLEPSIGHQAKCFPIDLQTLDSFQGPPNMEHSKGHQAWNLPLATKLGSSFTSLLPFFFKGTNLDHLSIFFLT